MSTARTPGHRWIDHGLRLHALSFGEDPPTIALIHGVGGHAWSWLPFVGALGEPARALAVDLRGHGDSQWSADGAYSTEALAADLTAILDQMGARDVTVVGASWGGLVGLVLAARRPDLVARLVMVDLAPSSAKAPEDVPPRPASFERHADVVAFERSRNPRGSPATWELLAAHGTRATEGGRLAPKHDPLFLRRWPFRAEDHWEALRSAERPILVVRAVDSPVLPEADAARMAAEARDGRLEPIAGTGHVVHVDDPAGLAAIVRTFAARTGG
jgi:pimeloyl-ACP methyl ester carboxylesterase